MAAIQDAYFAGVRDTVARYGGRLEKFIGDAAVAAFGVDRTREDDAERAVRCGLALVALVEALAGRLGMEAGSLRLRVGVDTGEVAVTTSGADEGRLTGDTMNVTARLQAAAVPGTVLCGESTVLSAAHAVAFGPSAPYTLKGKVEPVRAATALSVRPQASREAAMGALRAPTYGRATELSALREAVARARVGAVERWTILAPPGVGKSRLLDEIRRSVAADPAALLGLDARIRPDSSATMAAVAELLRAALGRDRDPAARLAAAGLPPERQEVLTAELRSVLRPTAGQALPPDLAEERTQRFAAWLELLDALAGPRAQVWLLEDVHWASGDLLAFIAAAGDGAARAGRLVIATARPSVLQDAAEWVDRPGARRLDLPRLEPDAARSLLGSLVGGALPDPLQRAVIERADGDPLFIEGLVRTWAGLGVLVVDGGRWRLTVQPAEVPVPTTVQAIYAAQLDDLPSAARDGLAVLDRRALVEGPQDVQPTGPAYAFRHALLRDAGYASLARAERARLHVQLARWLESIDGADPDAVAESIGRHYASALAQLPALAGGLPGDIDRRDLARLAAGWLERAAEGTLRTAAYDGAASLLRTSLELTPADDVLDLARRTQRLGEALAPSAGTTEALALQEEARRLFVGHLVSDAGDSAREGYARASAAGARILLEQLRFRDASRLAVDSLTVLGADDDAVAAPLVLAGAMAHLFE